jgi:hypothetical protein
MHEEEGEDVDIFAGCYGQKNEDVLTHPQIKKYKVSTLQ